MKHALQHFSIALPILALLWVGCVPKKPTATNATVTTVYLLRHAEKLPDPGDGNPSLSPEGETRAAALPSALASVTISGIYASEFSRTQETVAPLATQSGVAVEIVDAADPDGLAKRLKTDHPGKSVVACGHSNTVPDIAAALGVAEVITVEDSQYGDLWVVTLKADSVTLETRHFGP